MKRDVGLRIKEFEFLFEVLDCIPTSAFSAPKEVTSVGVCHCPSTQFTTPD